MAARGGNAGLATSGSGDVLAGSWPAWPRGGAAGAGVCLGRGAARVAGAELARRLGRWAIWHVNCRGRYRIDAAGFASRESSGVRPGNSERNAEGSRASSPSTRPRRGPAGRPIPGSRYPASVEKPSLPGAGCSVSATEALPGRLGVEHEVGRRLISSVRWIRAAVSTLRKAEREFRPELPAPRHARHSRESPGWWRASQDIRARLRRWWQHFLGRQPGDDVRQESSAARANPLILWALSCISARSGRERAGAVHHLETMPMGCRLTTR